MKNLIYNKSGKFNEKNFIILLAGVFFVFSIMVFVLAEGGSAGVWMNLSGNDTGGWANTELIHTIAVNTNDNLVYTTLGGNAGINF